MTKFLKTEIGIREAGGVQGDVATADFAGTDVVGILDSIDIPIVVIDRDCQVARFNRAATEVLV